MNLPARLYFLLPLFSLACQSASHEPGKAAVDTAASPKPENPRVALVAAIRHLDSTLASGDKASIGELIRWPLPYGNATMFSVDSALYAEETKTTFLTAEMYNRYAPPVDSVIRAEIRTLVRQADWNRLLTKDSVGYSEILPDLQCFTSYVAEVSGDTMVVLHFDLNANPQWKAKAKPAADESEGCQGTTFLTFSWNGKRLLWENLQSED
ncbi:hypothetical protein [Puia sp.]|jgi:hypothetical protein|uniref:hypothetical protein n=1 Tax=Puia sp. TaxID=2045100 RepID=UPI002F3E892D